MECVHHYNCWDAIRNVSHHCTPTVTVDQLKSVSNISRFVCILLMATFSWNLCNICWLITRWSSPFDASDVINTISLGARNKKVDLIVDFLSPKVMNNNSDITIRYLMGTDNFLNMGCYEIWNNFLYLKAVNSPPVMTF